MSSVSKKKYNNLCSFFSSRKKKYFSETKSYYSVQNGPCGQVVMDGPGMLTRFRFDLPTMRN